MSDSRVRELDLLRFAAASAVMLYHYSTSGFHGGHWTPLHYPAVNYPLRFGYLGVNLFFMISGFVILVTAARGSLRHFVISRVVRLCPAFWFSCTLAVVVAIVLPDPRFTATAGQYLANMAMISGFIGLKSIDGAYWSLFAELRFYFLVALALAFGQLDRIERWLWAWLLAAVLLSRWPVPHLANMLIYNFAEYFIAGAACQLVWSSGLNRRRATLLLLCWLTALVHALAGLAGASGQTHLLRDGVVLSLLVTGMFVLMLLVSLRRTGSLQRIEWAGLGAITYPLYLLHQNIGHILSARAWPRFGGTMVVLALVPAMYLLAYLVNRCIEVPMAPRFRQLLLRLSARVKPRASAG